ncbi:hypothetical protein A3Q56_06284, partial [Intoshia linei]
ALTYPPIDAEDGFDGYSRHSRKKKQYA